MFYITMLCFIMLLDFMRCIKFGVIWYNILMWCNVICNGMWCDVILFMYIYVRGTNRLEVWLYAHDTAAKQKGCRQLIDDIRGSLKLCSRLSVVSSDMVSSFCGIIWHSIIFLWYHLTWYHLSVVSSDMVSSFCGIIWHGIIGPLSVVSSDIVSSFCGIIWHSIIFLWYHLTWYHLSVVSSDMVSSDHFLWYHLTWYHRTTFCGIIWHGIIGPLSVVSSDMPQKLKSIELHDSCRDGLAMR